MAPMGDADCPWAGRRVWVAGHTGMVGAALCRRLATTGCHLLTVPRRQVDLRRQAQVEDWLAEHRPDTIFLAAATVGGILANDTRPADFLYDNLAIATNIIHGAWQVGVPRLLFLGSSCIYPRQAPQPIAEDALLTGPLEPTNEAYAIAKIAGLKLVQALRRQHGARYIACMPTNLYGPHDNFDPRSSHVLAALMRRIHEARVHNAESVTVWGTGTPRREFLHVDDLADACVFLAEHYDGDVPVNIGWGQDIAIAELANLLAEVIGWSGRLDFDTSRPDGMPVKRLDTRFMTGLGWQPRIALRDGIAATYAWYQQNAA